MSIDSKRTLAHQTGAPVERSTAMKEEQERAALAGIGFNILLLGFIAQWLEFFPGGIPGSILRLCVISLALSFFVIGVLGEE